MHKELANQQQEQRQRELKIKQDSMLEILMYKEQNKKLVSESEKKDRRHKTVVAGYEANVKSLGAQVIDLRGKHSAALGNAREWRENAQHLSELHKTIEEDLDALRRLEIAERSRISEQQKCRDLPPAYGSLDDPDRLPPWEAHADDSGRLELGAIKRTINANFMTRLANGHAMLEDQRNVSGVHDRETAGARFFYYMSLALEEAARSVTEILQHAEDVSCTHHAVPCDPVTLLPLADERTTSRRLKAKHSLVADRCATLLLNLTLRMVSTFEIRPTRISMVAGWKTTAALAWLTMDETLFATLPGALRDMSGSARLREVQLYSTQIGTLRSKLTNLRTGLSCGFFEQSSLWLDEQVEVERQMFAAAAAEEVASIETRVTNEYNGLNPGTPGTRTASAADDLSIGTQVANDHLDMHSGPGTPAPEPSREATPQPEDERIEFVIARQFNEQYAAEYYRRLNHASAPYSVVREP